MLKMFTTQLNGLFQRIADKEAETVEDGARLLAQAAIGEGAIYIKGFREMKAVEAEALEGAEPLPHAKELSDISALTAVDRAVLVTRFAHDEQAIAVAKALQEKHVPFVAIAGAAASDQESLADIADFFIDTHLIKGLIPDESGGRTGFSSGMAGLYIYFLLKITMDEILLDNEELPEMG